MQFEFVTDKKNNTITVKREFAAKRQLVWDCHTKSALLEKWFAPKPFTAKTKSMEFKEGGHWIYAMVGPDGKEYWGRTGYLKINPIDGYQTSDAFADENGDVNPELPTAKWDVTFSDKGNHTVVTTVVTYPSLEGLETVLNMGMQEGLAAALENLDELLLSIAK
jgi:uncharacterized protein YndB with AHSA1/START domain